VINVASAVQGAPAVGPGVHAADNLQMMSQTVLSGADPALADIAGTSAKISGTDPTGYIQALASSWFGTTAPGEYASSKGSSDTPGEQAVADPTWLTKTALAVLAIGLILIGAVALILPSAEKGIATVAKAA
jgi:hypothetical protein